MAATILVRDLIGRVSDSLTDTNPQFTRWAEPVLIGWLNEAQLVIAKYLPFSCSRVDSVRLAPGTRQSIATIAQTHIIPGDGSAAAAVNGNALLAVVRNMGATGTTPGRAIRIVDQDVLDASNPDWHIATPAAVVRQYTFDPRTPKSFYVSPPVHPTTQCWVELSFMADPKAIPVGSALSGSTVRISVDDKNSDDLFNYIMARAQMKDAEIDGNAQLANSYVTMFTSSINAQATALLGVNPNLTSLPLNPSVPAAAR